MQKHTNFSLKNYNTFGIDEVAEEFFFLESEDDVRTFARDKEALSRLKLILGGGSNLLLTGSVKGLIAYVAIPGIRILERREDYVIAEVGAGEIWHQFVLWALENNFGGLENLSLIPGQTGTAPVQNIGAYGVELKDCFHSLDGIHLGSGEKQTLDLAACRFSYRNSIFKEKLKGRFIITAVRFKLTTQNHSIRTEYGSVSDKLSEMGITSPGIQDVSSAVIAIRQSKLPDPKLLGNSGSFFKNPAIELSRFNELKKQFPDIVAYPAGENKMKLAAGWMIEKAGWKGFRRGDAGVHDKQALVLVNYGSARGAEVYALALEIIEDIANRYGVKLEPEVNIL